MLCYNIMGTYYENFKEKNKDKIKEKIKCHCGGSYTYFNKYRHMKSRKHINNTIDKDTRLSKIKDKIDIDDDKLKNIIEQVKYYNL